MQFQFTPSFLWGAAISSYQCEGNIFNVDWFLWEQEKKLEKAGAACDHYNLYQKDFVLAKQLNLNALRISIEWARIFPQPGMLDAKALDHYCQVIADLRQLNIKPVVTLHHFTNPIWFEQNNGWADSKNIRSFIEYVKVVATALKDQVDIWLTINEPSVYVFNGCIEGIWPPGKRSIIVAAKIIKNLALAHCAAYQQIKEIYAKNNQPVSISLAHHMRGFYPCRQGSKRLNSLASGWRNQAFNFWFIDYLNWRKTLDFIGLNFYCRESNQFNLLGGKECGHNHGYRKNAMGWQVDSNALYDLLIQLKKYKKPILITENGTAENDDELYKQYMLSHIKAVAKACRDKADVLGYLWWSLLDNFEWDKGFDRRFGLISVNYADQTRAIKPFAFNYADICRDNKIEID